MIRSRGESIELEVAANAALWELQTATEVVQLLVAQSFTITRAQAYHLVHSMDVIENELAGKSRPDAIALLTTSAANLHVHIRDLHLAVTGEDASY